MKKISLTKQKFALVDDHRYEELSKHKWYCLNGKYAARDQHIRYKNGKTTKKTILMHRQIANAPEFKVIDHINGDGLYNLESNLRVCDQSQNCMNQEKRASAYSKYKGVTYNKNRKKWAAKIMKDRKTINLGYFDSEINAAKAYNSAAIKYFGNFAKLNILEN